MEKKTLIAALGVAAMTGGSAFAGSALDVISKYADGTDDAAVVFQDTTFSLIPTGPLGLGSRVVAYVSVDQVGLGLSDPDGLLPVALDESLTNNPFPADAVNLAGISVFAKLDSVVTSVSLDALGNGTIGLGPANSTLASFYVSDVFQSATPADLASEATADAFFTDLNANNVLAATFGLDGVDDFYTLTLAGGVVTDFELALSEIDNFLLPGVQSGSVTTGGGTILADLYAQGGNFSSTPSGAFSTGDGDFAIDLIPSPAAMGPGVIAMAALGLGRMRRRREQA